MLSTSRVDPTSEILTQRHGLKPETRQRARVQGGGVRQPLAGGGKPCSSMPTVVLSRHLVTPPCQRIKLLFSLPVMCSSASPPHRKLTPRSPAEPSPTPHLPASTRNQCKSTPVWGPYHGPTGSFSLHPCLNHPRLRQAPPTPQECSAVWQAGKTETSQDLLPSLRQATTMLSTLPGLPARQLDPSLTLVWSLANCLSSSKVWVYTRLLYRNCKREECQI